MSGPLCQCGHDRTKHTLARGCGTYLETSWCPCRQFDDAVLPAPGERLTFGVHRIPARDAETAEAWPPLATWASRVSQRTSKALRRK